jgi:hypothetical protein
MLAFFDAQARGISNDAGPVSAAFVVGEPTLAFEVDVSRALGYFPGNHAPELQKPIPARGPGFRD